MFDNLTTPAPDALHGIMDAYRADPRPEKMDLGVGMYRDADGRCPVIGAVKDAEVALTLSQSSKGYLPLAGAPAFIDSMLRMVLSDSHSARLEGRVAAVQTPGGTGALFLGGSLVNATSNQAAAWVGNPTWPSHAPLLTYTGLRVQQYDYLSDDRRSVSSDSVMEACGSAARGDIFLLHGPCHNPTGMDLSRDERADILDVLEQRGAVPMLDVAYAGLGQGMNIDLKIVRDAMNRERAIVAFSCSKSFSLYRERTGMLMVTCADRAERDIVQRVLERIARSAWSMAPAHGAEVVGMILSDPERESAWRGELESMRERIQMVRQRLTRADRTGMLSAVGEGQGIFSVLPITPQQVQHLADDHAIYMAPTGRINVAGFKEGDEERFSAALATL
ncbi:MAG: aromatic amino acid transaminase [Pseudomonadota bacterium]